MKNRNLLEELRMGRLTSDSALEIVEEIIDSDDAQHVEDLLGFSREEWTAYAQGASLAAISKWRYEGWPSHCHKCGADVFVAKFGWLVVQSEDKFFIKHIKCPERTAEPTPKLTGEG